VYGRIHHVGFVVRDLPRAERDFEALGYARRGPVVRDDFQRAELLFLVRVSATAPEPLVELIRPVDESSKTYSFTTRNELQIHHLCYVTDDLASACALALRQKFVQVQPPTPAPAIGGSQIAFFYGRPIGLFELVERPPF
jgi:methylmalonyl-CoA/ethylmalonyl-CoA epimerase